MADNYGSEDDFGNNIDDDVVEDDGYSDESEREQDYSETPAEEGEDLENLEG